MNQVKNSICVLFINACEEGDITIIKLLISFYNNNPNYKYYYDMLLEKGLSRVIINNHIHILFYFNILYKRNIHYNEIIRTAIILSDKRKCNKIILNYITNRFGFNYKKNILL